MRKGFYGLHTLFMSIFALLLCLGVIGVSIWFCFKVGSTEKEAADFCHAIGEENYEYKSYPRGGGVYCTVYDSEGYQVMTKHSPREFNQWKESKR